MKTYYVSVDGIDVVVTQNSDGTFNIPNIFRGLGTALKPANEPILLARKPISEKTIAENVLKWGTGALNIDRCRIAVRMGSGSASALSRFPANILLDEEAGRMLDEQSGITKSTGGRSKGGMGKNVYGKYALDRYGANAGGLGDTGGA